MEPMFIRASLPWVNNGDHTRYRMHARRRSGCSLECLPSRVRMQWLVCMQTRRGGGVFDEGWSGTAEYKRCPVPWLLHDLLLLMGALVRGVWGRESGVSGGVPSSLSRCTRRNFQAHAHVWDFRRKRSALPVHSISIRWKPVYQLLYATLPFLGHHVPRDVLRWYQRGSPRQRKRRNGPLGRERGTQTGEGGRPPTEEVDPARWVGSKACGKAACETALHRPTQHPPPKETESFDHRR